MIFGNSLSPSFSPFALAKAPKYSTVSCVEQKTTVLRGTSLVVVIAVIIVVAMDG